MKWTQKKLFVLYIIVLAGFNSTPVLASANEDGYFIRLFDAVIGAVEPYFNAIESAVTDFYNEYSTIGVIVAAVVIFIAIFVLIFILGLLKFILRKIKLFFRIITGIEKRRRERDEKLRRERMVRRDNYNDLLKWRSTSKNKGREHLGERYWESEVTKAAAEITVAEAADRETEEQLWQDIISGAVSYNDKLGEIERVLFSIEDKINALIEKITSLPKEDLVKETARLRIGLVNLKKDKEYLQRLQETFPEDTNITPLIELCEAFIQATKGVEKGFIAALTE